MILLWLACVFPNENPKNGDSAAATDPVTEETVKDTTGRSGTLKIPVHLDKNNTLLQVDAALRGGAVAPACASGKICIRKDDCAGGLYCLAGRCLAQASAATCGDGPSR